MRPGGPMSVVGDARQDALRSWREFSSEPERVEDMRRHATDLLCDHFDRVNGGLEGLDEGERMAYIAFLADSLATGLLRYIGFWVVNDFVTLEEWRQGLDDVA
jgi:hypothetical protein